ncbi:rac GTPase-activating protein 1-like [Leptopilina heterotoma]|uniref:rac GTPase-activating protein 1-like n=1 Tax=Leptopilina heterotoma TaxID=63436 RepID=UPI001CA7ED88|nr:rac GTPase-activating protein 1-like [Leptopilina heterotoma]
MLRLQHSLLIFSLVIYLVNGRTKHDKAGKSSENSSLIPKTVIKYVEEIERRGMKTKGLYKLTGDEDEVRGLISVVEKDKAADISDYNIEAITTALKKFLRKHFHGELVDEVKAGRLVNALLTETQEDMENEMKKIISKIRRKNRETLAYMIRHLQKVLNGGGTVMSALDIAKELSPVLIRELPPSINIMEQFVQEKEIKHFFKQTTQIVRNLLLISTDFWEDLIPNLTSDESVVSNSEEEGEGEENKEAEEGEAEVSEEKNN